MSQVAFSAPHKQAAEIGLEVLKDGGSAVDATIAAAAAVSVLYPHMNSLAGDGFWLIHRPGETPRAIDACGSAAQLASIDWYHQRGCKHIPSRGALAALTPGGTLSGWQVARAISAERQSLMPLQDLLAPAVAVANRGIVVSRSLANASHKVAAELVEQQEYRRVFMPEGRPLRVGEHFSNPDLAQFLQELSTAGLQDAFTGELARRIAEGLWEAGSPIRFADLQAYTACEVKPLSVATRFGRCYNLPAPTQGVASLLILAIYDRIFQSDWGQAESIHSLIEAAKQAFMVRDREVADPNRLSRRWPDLLTPASIDQLAARITDRAMPWPYSAEPGDTVWLGCVDSAGTMVSFIQSIYWEFGSGVVLPGLGLLWNNRGCSFSLATHHRNALRPGCKPYHTLNPAFALLNDGRRLSYGTMGGEGQPQTQSAIVARYIYQGMPLQEAIACGRWLLGRTWGERHVDLQVEQDLLDLVGAQLSARGHALKPVAACNELMGHAGAVVSHSDGCANAASDPRSDGAGLVAEVHYE